MIENNIPEEFLKLCILKPIMWSNNKYIKPSGYISSSGFSKENGYGHEEWNNNQKWLWRNYKIFHTEIKDHLKIYSKNGNLCILMISSFDSKQYAVGIATNVYHNDNDERNIISEELNTYDNYEVLWELNSVKKAFSNLEEFKNHWKDSHKWIQWKCPKNNYHWFEKPILLNPQDISGKKKLISMHSGYQVILPQKVLEIIHQQIKGRNEILKWLTTGEFDNEKVKIKSKVETNNNLRKKYFSSGANASSNNSFSYWIEGNRNVEPLHSKLQARFVRFLSERNIKYEEDKQYIDVKYEINNEVHFCEIKPTEKILTKYAIRIAIGQLFEYRYKIDGKAILVIVLSTMPKKEEISFIKHLKIKLFYYENKVGTFIEV